MNTALHGWYAVPLLYQLVLQTGKATITFFPQYNSGNPCHYLRSFVHYWYVDILAAANYIDIVN